ncbi:hypothetical protein Ancab_000870 [Ancistrocladus abbreviatus]
MNASLATTAVAEDGSKRCPLGGEVHQTPLYSARTNFVIHNVALFAAGGWMNVS